MLQRHFRREKRIVSRVLRFAFVVSRPETSSKTIRSLASKTRRWLERANLLVATPQALKVSDVLATCLLAADQVMEMQIVVLRRACDSCESISKACQPMGSTLVQASVFMVPNDWSPLCVGRTSWVCTSK